MTFKALVTVDVFVKGERCRFSAGDEVAGLSVVDAADLLACGALEDVEATAAAAKRALAAEKLAHKEFNDGRLEQQARQAAIEAAGIAGAASKTKS